jgi:hypothetical protein
VILIIEKKQRKLQKNSMLDSQIADQKPENPMVAIMN